MIHPCHLVDTSIALKRPLYSEIGARTKQLEKEEARRVALEEAKMKNDARRIITSQRVSSIRRFGKYSLNWNRKDISHKQKAAYKEVDYCRNVLTKAEANLYLIEKEKRGILKREERVNDCRAVAKTLAYPVPDPIRTVTLGELIDEEENRKRKAGELNNSSEETELKSSKPKRRKLKKKKPIEKLGMRKSVLDSSYPSEDNYSDIHPTNNQAERRIVTDTNSYNFSSDQTRRLFLRAREKWESLGKAQTPSTGLPQPTSSESTQNSPKNTRSAKTKWEIDPSSSGIAPKKGCSDSSRRSKKGAKKRKNEWRKNAARRSPIVTSDDETATKSPSCPTSTPSTE